MYMCVGTSVSIYAYRLSVKVCMYVFIYVCKHLFDWCRLRVRKPKNCFDNSEPAVSQLLERKKRFM